MQPTDIALGGPPELDGKILLHITLGRGRGEIKLVLTKKHPFHWLVFTVLEAVVQAVEGNIH